MFGIFGRKKDLTPTLGPLTERDPTLDEHFRLSQDIPVHYRARDTDPATLARAIETCERQIAIQEQAAKAMRRKGITHPDHSLPRHVGYEQLAVIREKQGRLDDAIKLSTDAMKAGWSGDWGKRIDRLEKKRAKTA